MNLPSPRHELMNRVVLPFLLTLIPHYAAAQVGPVDPKQFHRQKSKFSFDLPKTSEGGNVQVKADHQEFVRDDYAILEGNVQIKYGDIVLSGDKVIHNLRTKDVTAEGHVILDQGPRRLSAERIVYNLESQTGTLFNASGSFEPSVYFTGEKIEKVSERTYRLTNGVFTSCDINDPDWSFRLERGTVTVEDYARLSHVSFRAGRVPLFWTPYIVWPTKRDRARGFLVPKLGGSDYGTFVEAAYFIPIREWADVTLTGSYFSDGYHAAGSGIRYKPDVNIEGEFSGQVVRNIGPPGAAAERDEAYEWKYAYTHTQEGLPGGFRGVIDVRDFSDLNFFQGFERRFELTTISNIYSSAYLTKNRERYSLNIRSDRRKHFLGGDRLQVFQQLPTIQYSVLPQQFGNSPFYYELESSASHLRNETSFGPSERTSTNYERADLFPRISMRLNTPTWISVKPQLSLRQTYYSASLSEPFSPRIVDEALSRSYAQAQVELTGPSLSRIYQKELGGFSRFKHVIEPRVRYLYTTEADEQNRVIRFDTVDSPLLPIVRDSVEYSLTQRIIGKEKAAGASARDIMSLSFRQTVSLSKPFQTSPFANGRTHRFTPLLMTLHINPYQALTLNAGATLGNVSHQLDQANLSASLASETSYLHLTWFATFLPPGQTVGDSSQYRVSVGSPFWQDRFRGDVQLNYDAKNGKLLEHRYIVGFNASCYNVAVEYRDFAEFDPSTSGDRNRQYHISVGLKNVGQFVDVGGRLDRLFEE